MRGSVRIAAGVAGLFVLVSGCGALPQVSAGSAAALATATRSAPVGACAQSPTVAPSPDCEQSLIQLYQQTNQSFNARQTLPASVVKQAQPITARIRQALQALTPTQRGQQGTVRSTLIAAGVRSDDLIVDSDAGEVAFYGYESLNTRPAVCADGDVMANSVVVTMESVTNDGSCAPSPGGH